MDTMKDRIDLLCQTIACSKRSSRTLPYANLAVMLRVHPSTVYRWANDETELSWRHAMRFEKLERRYYEMVEEEYDE